MHDLESLKKQAENNFHRTRKSLIGVNINQCPVLSQLEFEVYHQGEIKKIKLTDYKGKWIVLFFYPADFTFVCPTELQELADNYATFKELGIEIVSVSTDTVFVHKAWHDESKAVGKVKFPMLADPAAKLAKHLGVYIEDEGVALRATFIINPDGQIVTYEVNDNNIGRSTKELIRKLQAAQFVREHNGQEVCPASWQPDKESLKPSLELVGKI